MVGFIMVRIPVFPMDVVREVLLNTITHRDYLSIGKILVRHTQRELVVSGPGGFGGGVTAENILRHEAVTRNSALAQMFQKLGLVETAGIGRRRIFETMLAYGKRLPRYESDGHSVVLRLLDETIDKPMATLVAKWHSEGISLGLIAKSKSEGNRVSENTTSRCHPGRIF